MAQGQPRAIGIAGLPQMTRFGGYSAGAAAATGSASQAAQDADATKWYESGPFWTLVFLFVGYILVYRTLR